MSSDINVQTFSGKVNITSNLLVGSSHLFVDTINNRVGLVTNTPDAGLHVNSNAYVHTNFRVGSGIVMNDTTGRITAGSFVGDGSAMTGINSDSGSWVNGTDVVHLATTGDKVGIGTASPATNLNIQGDSGGVPPTTGGEGTSNGIFRVRDNYNVALDIGTKGSSPWTTWLQVADATSMGTEYPLSLQPNGGNVGIGTDDPKQPLEVKTDAVVSGRLGVGTVLTSAQNAGGQDIWNLGTAARLVVRCLNNADTTASYANAKAYAGIALVPGFDASDTTNIGLWGSGSGENPKFYIQNMINNGANGGGYVLLQPVAGNVGIGTTSPGTRLHVQGSSGELFRYTDGTRTVYGGCDSNNPWFGTSTNHSLRITTNGTTRMTIDETGNVGIGKADPLSLLDIKVSSTSPAIRFSDSGQNRYACGIGGVHISGEGQRLDFYVGDSGSNTTNLDSGDLRMSIKHNGNVGIGTSSPYKLLHLHELDGEGVHRTLLWSSYRSSNNQNPQLGYLGTADGAYASGALGLFMNTQLGGTEDETVRIQGNGVSWFNGGNVGIGTPSPASLLEVRGTNTSHNTTIYPLAVSTVSSSSTQVEEGIGTGIEFRVERRNTDNIQGHCGAIRVYGAGGIPGTSDLWNMAFRVRSNDTIYEPMTIRYNGNVGIGTDSPSYKLDVAGNLRVTTGIVDTSWCSGSWGQTCSQSPTVSVFSNNGGGPMSIPGHGGSGMGGNRGRFTAKKAGNYLISCCVVSAGRGTTTSSGSSLLVTFQASGTNWDPNNVINTYREILDLRSTPSVEEAYTFACQVYMNVGHYLSFQVHSSGYIDNSAYLLCSAALVR